MDLSLPENRITPMELPMEIIPSQILSELADGKIPSAMPPVYTDGIIPSVYTGGVKFFLKITMAGWRGFYADEFTDRNTEGFKPGQPSRDV